MENDLSIWIRLATFKAATAGVVENMAGEEDMLRVSVAPSSPL